MHRLSVALAMLLLLVTPIVSAQGSLNIYDDGLASGWQNWSWDTTVNLNATAQVQSGSSALSATMTQAWAGLYLRSGGPLPAGYSTLRFWLHGGSGGQSLTVALYNEAGQGMNAAQVTASAGWTQVDVPLDVLGSSALLWGVVLQDAQGSAQPTFYIDNVQLVGGGSGPTPVPGTGPTLSIDAAADRAPISPDIYGMNFASRELAADVRLTVNRWGGNSTTRYNWQIDVSNRGSDWFFQNIPNDVVNESALPNGSAADQFVIDNQATNTQSLMTIPMIGWTARSRIYAQCSFSVARYGAQQRVDQWYPDCGNGVRPDGRFVTGNDPNDANLPINETFVQDWMRHLIGQFGTAGQGGVRFYALDNEPALWHETHRDVWPQPLGSIALRDLTYRYAAAVKAIDPGALTLGPVEWGWTNYFYSAVDSASGQWGNPPEAGLRGGLPLAAWYLDQMRQYEQANGVGILDYFDLHYYPQASGVTLTSAGGAATQTLRLRSTRSLWDPTYVDESWINEPVRLIPRMREWVNTYYPGTRIAITEYNWGGYEHINGALAQADVLGIFGREGVDLATIWVAPDFNEPVAFAFRMYRNYDGIGSGFGETRVRATSSDQAQVSTYAALRADGALTVMIVNKSGTPVTSPLNIANFSGGTAEVYRYSSANLSQIVREADVTLSSGSASLTLPANAITLLVIRPGAAQAQIDATVALQGRTSGTAALAVPVRVQLRLGANVTQQANPTLNSGGAFQLVGMAAGSYRLWVKPAQYLAAGVDVAASGVTAAALGPLRAGDVNDDNRVTLVDFSLLAASFNRRAGAAGYDGRADLNGDSQVTLIDFSLLASNFNQSGDS